MNEPTRYNGVYEHLVERDDDVIGLVAYALYKQDKRDWLISRRERNGTHPSENEIDVYVSSQMTSGQRIRFRQAAQDVLDAYALVAVEAERPNIIEDAVTTRMEKAAETVETSTRWYWQIPAGIASALIYTVLLILLAVVLRYAGIDLLSVLKTS